MVDDSETVEVEIAKDVKVHVVRAMIADVKGKPNLQNRDRVTLQLLQ